MGCDAGYGARTVSAVSEKYIGGDSLIASIGDLFTPYAHLGNSLPAQLYAYGMLAYSTNAIIVATLLTYYVVNILLIDPPGPNTNPVAMVGMYAWCYCLVGR